MSKCRRRSLQSLPLDGVAAELSGWQASCERIERLVGEQLQAKDSQAKGQNALEGFKAQRIPLLEALQAASQSVLEAEAADRSQSQLVAALPTEAELAAQLRELEQQKAAVTELERLAGECRQDAVAVAALTSDASDLERAVAELETARPKVLAELERLRAEIADKEKILRQQLQIQQLDAYRAALEPKQPCPLCGSETHPKIAEYQQLESNETETSLKDKQRLENDMRSQLGSLEADMAAKAAEARRIHSTKADLSKQLEEKSKRWSALAARVNSEAVNSAGDGQLIPPDSSSDAVVAGLSQTKEQISAGLSDVQSLVTSAARCRAAYQQTQQQLALVVQQKATTESELTLIDSRVVDGERWLDSQRKTAKGLVEQDEPANRTRARGQPRALPGIFLERGNKRNSGWWYFNQPDVFYIFGK